MTENGNPDIFLLESNILFNLSKEEQSGNQKVGVLIENPLDELADFESLCDWIVGLITSKALSTRLSEAEIQKQARQIQQELLPRLHNWVSEISPNFPVTALYAYLILANFNYVLAEMEK